MKNKSKIFLAILLIIVIIAIIVIYSPNIINKNHYEDMVTTGIVIGKFEDKEGYKINLLLEKQKKDIIIIIREKNIWNLVEKNRAYFIGVERKNEGQWNLSQIEINDKYKSINK